MPALRTFLILDRGLTPDRADDVLQSFVVSKVLEQAVLGRPDPTQGKFRTFLLATLKHFVIDLGRAEQLRDRAPGTGAAVRLDEAPELPADEPSPSERFDVAWAREVIGAAVALMKVECDTGGRPEIWGVFEGRVLRPALEGTAPADYGELVRRFGLRTPRQASNVLVTGKRLFARALRSVVSEYAQGNAIDDEVNDLKAIAARRR